MASTPIKRAKLRSTLLIIILATLPCYCLGLIVLYFGDSSGGGATPTATSPIQMRVTPSQTPILLATTALISPTASNTPTITLTASPTRTYSLPTTQVPTATLTHTLVPTATPTDTPTPTEYIPPTLTAGVSLPTP